eukprot:3239182-Rhodomonas_salina.2
MLGPGEPAELPILSTLSDDLSGLFVAALPWKGTRRIGDEPGSTRKFHKSRDLPGLKTTAGAQPA